MADTLEQAREIVKARIAEIDAERARLQQALDQLGGDSTASAPQRRTSPAASGTQRKRSRRASPGERERQLLSSLQSNPERRISEHARELGVRPQQLYPLLKRLQQRELVEKTESGYRAKS